MKRHFEFDDTYKKMIHIFCNDRLEGSLLLLSSSVDVVLHQIKNINKPNNKAKAERNTRNWKPLIQDALQQLSINNTGVDKMAKSAGS